MFSEVLLASLLLMATEASMKERLFRKMPVSQFSAFKTVHNISNVVRIWLESGVSNLIFPPRWSAGSSAWPRPTATASSSKRLCCQHWSQPVASGGSTYLRTPPPPSCVTYPVNHINTRRPTHFISSSLPYYLPLGWSGQASEQPYMQPIPYLGPGYEEIDT